MSAAGMPAKAGFSLVELLIATSIVLVIGGIAGALLMQSFTLWEHGLSRTRRWVPADAALTLLARDFASSVGAMGWTGTPTRCQFWTLEPRGTAAANLTAVDYEMLPDGIVRRASRPGTTSLGEQRLAPVAATRLRYGAAGEPPEVWREEWSSPTNAPARLLLQPPDGGDGHLLLRRTP